MSASIGHLSGISQLRNRNSDRKSNNASDSEGSDSNSLSQESITEVKAATSGVKRPVRRSSEWEILEGLRDGERYEQKPEVFKGYLQKKRKWPLKGWHKFSVCLQNQVQGGFCREQNSQLSSAHEHYVLPQPTDVERIRPSHLIRSSIMRYFVLDTGILRYGKSPQDISKGKIHGSVDIGLSVISTKSKRKRIDIDTEEFIYHLKAKQYEVFEEWAEQLKKHRLYRQHLLTFGSKFSNSTEDDIPHKQPLARKLATEGSPPQRGLQWVLDGPLQVAMTELNHTQQALNQLSRILDRIEHGNHDAESIADGFSPNVKKDRKRFGLRKKKSNKGSSVDLTNAARDGEFNPQTLSPGGSSPNRPLSGEQTCPIVTLSNLDNSSASDFYILAKDICSSLKSVIYTLQTEKEKLKGSSEEKLRNVLSSVLSQNAELRSRLNVVHKSSDIADLPDGLPADELIKEVHEAKNDSEKINGIIMNIVSENRAVRDKINLLYKLSKGMSETSSHPSLTRPIQSSLSYSSCTSEYLDAKEDLDAASETSSPAVSSEDLSESSIASDMAGSEYNLTVDFPTTAAAAATDLTGRRSVLPAPQPSAEGLSLWNLLSKNIGKDLSQVSMPVALNEPLNMLQRLCEELEYSELLDKAAELTDPFERMVHVAAFAVSSYGSTYYRAGSKPFNPLLGETYENIREDKGFKFVSEQVSHHPPISVCHASSRNFTFWADSRIKTKFWGRSMEFQPMGYVNVRLERPDGGHDIYRWNKVTSCLHNLFGGQRWVDQYGELVITTPGITCQLNFVKASFWSQKKHEVVGTVIDVRENKVVRKLFGKWSEAIYCGEQAPSAKCIWRQGTMPHDYEIYYGFTRFAIELNELQSDMASYLPKTDTRLRPDQRLLEEGKLDEAERVKLSLEQAQRERRRRYEQEGVVYEPRWFKKIIRDDMEHWDLQDYWTARKNGFANVDIEPLW